MYTRRIRTQASIVKGEASDVFELSEVVRGTVEN